MHTFRGNSTTQRVTRGRNSPPPSSPPEGHSGMEHHVIGGTERQKAPPGSQGRGSDISAFGVLVRVGRRLTDMGVEKNEPSTRAQGTRQGVTMGRSPPPDPGSLGLWGPGPDGAATTSPDLDRPANGWRTYLRPGLHHNSRR